MTCKSSQCYISVLEYIENNIMNLQPNQFMTDWELSERVALRRVYPGIDLRGCWFHYCNAIRRRRQKMGIKFHRLLEANKKAKLIYRQLQLIPLLPAEYIVDGFEEICHKARVQHFDKYFQDMFVYFQKYWLNVVSLYSKRMFLLSYVRPSVHAFVRPFIRKMK